MENYEIVYLLSFLPFAFPKGKCGRDEHGGTERGVRLLDAGRGK